jgi:hypothetical protein
MGISFVCIRNEYWEQHMVQNQNQVNVLLLIFVSNADKKDNSSVVQSLIYKLLYSESITAPSFRRNVHSREDRAAHDETLLASAQKKIQRKSSSHSALFTRVARSVQQCNSSFDRSGGLSFNYELDSADIYTVARHCHFRVGCTY